MDMHHSQEAHAEIREEVRKLCARFPGEYWRELDTRRGYPTEFVKALTDAGWLAALIPEEFGGSGLPLSAAAAILEEIHATGCNAAACHAQMYIMGTILKHGSLEQKQKYLVPLAKGEKIGAATTTTAAAATSRAGAAATARAKGAFSLDAATEDELYEHMKGASMVNPVAGEPPSLPYPPHERCVEIEIDLAAGKAACTVHGSDLTQEYVSINADYRS